MGRQSRVGGPPPQGPVPVLAGLMDGNGCSIGTHILSYKPKVLNNCALQINDRYETAPVAIRQPGPFDVSHETFRLVSPTRSSES